MFGNKRASDFKEMLMCIVWLSPFFSMVVILVRINTFHIKPSSQFHVSYLSALNGVKMYGTIRSQAVLRQCSSRAELHWSNLLMLISEK